MRLYDCVGVNRSGEVVREELPKKETLRWLNHHQRMFPSWGLMVDGVFHHWGLFVASEIHIFETQYLIDAKRSLIRCPSLVYCK